MLSVEDEAVIPDQVRDRLRRASREGDTPGRRRLPQGSCCRGPYTFHTALTDNGTHFTGQTGDAWTPVEIKATRADKVLFRRHSFEAACAAPDIERRLTKPRHPWTNGQVEPVNRTIKDATVKRFHYESYDQLRQHLTDFVAAYNFARRLKTLRGLTPYEAICKVHTRPAPSNFGTKQLANT